MREWVLLSAVLSCLLAVGCQRSSLFSKRGFVYGTVEHPVKIYVKLHQSSPVLICMDMNRANKEMVDPTYLWIGPNENTLTGNSQINITNTGKLIVQDFKENSSGLYTCTLSYKTIKAETQEENTIKKRYDFMMFAQLFLFSFSLQSLSEPDYSYRMAVRFTTKSCAGRYNDLFFRVLKKILNNLISDLSCHVIEPSYKCHSVKIPDHDFIYELFIAFQVNPFAPGWENACNSSADCEDSTNHNILTWFVVLELSVLMLMLLVRFAFLSMPTVLSLACKLQD